MNTAQELPNERDKELIVSTWPQNSQNPNLNEHPWDVPEMMIHGGPIV